MLRKAYQFVLVPGQPGLPYLPASKSCQSATPPAPTRATTTTVCGTSTVTTYAGVDANGSSLTATSTRQILTGYSDYTYFSANYALILPQTRRVVSEQTTSFCREVTTYA
jgi:hypothetical protein